MHFQIYGEPHEEANPIYVNVFPLTYEHPMSSRLSLKTGTIISLRFADTISLGNTGIKLGLPLYLSTFQDGHMAGFFAGPLVQVSRNNHTREIVISSAIDLGYSLYFSDSISMTIGLEGGVSTFFLDGDIALRSHIGPGIYLFGQLPTPEKSR